ncbi:hypothetical protein HW555_013109 [Spodoptera exigua]|uniref:Uncharacterized protein n=1 Tax=Spodoptera exigua TaxID=7107 RepID=A0A835G5X0_SPOEX|nr:hypothetical protein HW555_013109 [Spodoptera exigua]
MGPVLSPCPLQGEDDNLQVGLSLAESVQRFWEVEEPPSAPRQNPEHLECESFFQNNTGRLCSGRHLSARRSSSVLSPEERQEALMFWVRFVQGNEYAPIVLEAWSNSEAIPRVGWCSASSGGLGGRFHFKKSRGRQQTVSMASQYLISADVDYETWAMTAWVRFSCTYKEQ